jgi:nucleoside phosphorylase
MKEPEMKTHRADVAILTAVPPELIATKIAFNIHLEKREDEYVNGLRFWETPLTDSTGRQIDILITMIGESGNVSCAAACDRLFNTYDVGLCILVGVAAGLSSKVKLGDVVAADIVLDYENARLEPDGAKKRPRQFSPGIQIGRDLEYFNPRQHNWYDILRQASGQLREVTYLDARPNEDFWNPEFVSGVILSGEKLIADGSLDERRKEYHDRIRAAEMEGRGFARMCEEHSVPWLVFRGISDYGDIQKTKDWQGTSALAAATAARVFIERGYKKPT